MSKRVAVIFAVICLGIGAFVTGFFVTHHGGPTRYQAGTSETGKAQAQAHIQPRTEQMKPVQQIAEEPICVRVVAGDTFSDLTHDLYGNGEPKVYFIAALAVQGLADPLNPNFIEVGQVLAFPLTLTVGGEELHASYAHAMSRWEDRHERSARAIARAHARTYAMQIFVTPNLSAPQRKVVFTDPPAPILDAVDAPAPMPLAIMFASPSHLARPDPPQVRKTTRKRRVLHAFVRIGGNVGIFAANGAIMSLRTGNPFVGFGIVGGGTVASFLIHRHERKLQRRLQNER